MKRPRLPFPLTRLPDPRNPSAAPWAPRALRYIASTFSFSDTCEGYDHETDAAHRESTEARYLGRTVVPIVSPHGTPPAGTMGHVYVADLSGRFLGLVAIRCLAPLPPRARKATRDILRANQGKPVEGRMRTDGTGRSVGIV